MADLKIGIDSTQFKQGLKDAEKAMEDFAKKADETLAKSVKDNRYHVGNETAKTVQKIVADSEKALLPLQRLQKEMAKYEAPSLKFTEQFYKNVRLFTKEVEEFSQSGTFYANAIKKQVKDIDRYSQTLSKSTKQIQYSLNSLNFTPVTKSLMKLTSDITNLEKKNLISYKETTTALTPLENILKQVNRFAGNQTQGLLVRVEDINIKALSPLLYQIKRNAISSAVSEAQGKFFKWQMSEVIKSLTSLTSMPFFRFANQSFLNMDSFGNKATLPFFKEVIEAIKKTSKSSGLFSSTKGWDDWNKSMRRAIDSYYGNYNKTGFLSNNEKKQIELLSNIDQHTAFLKRLTDTVVVDTNFGKRSLQHTGINTNYDQISTYQFIESILARALMVTGTHDADLFESILTNFEQKVLNKLLTKLNKLDFYPDKNIERIYHSPYSDKMTGGFEVDRLWVKQAEIQSFTPSTTLPDYAAIPTDIDLSKPDTKKITQYVKSFSDYFEYIKDIMFVNLESGLKSFTGSRGLAGLRQINTVLDYGKKLFDTLPMFTEISEQILSLSANDTDLSPQQLKKFQRVNKNVFSLLTEAYKTSALVPTLTTSAKSYFDQTSQANIVTTSMSGEDFAQAATAKSVSVMLKDLFQKGAKSIFFKAIQNISTADIFPMDTEYSTHIVRALEYLNLQISKYSGSWADSLNQFLTDFNTNLLQDVLLLADKNMLNSKFIPSDKQKSAAKMLGNLAGEAVLENKRIIIERLENQLLIEYEKAKALRGKHENDIGITSQDMKKMIHNHVPIIEWLKLISNNFDDAIANFNEKRLSANLIPHQSAIKKFLMPKHFQDQISDLLTGVAQESIGSVINQIHGATDESSQELSKAIKRFGIPGLTDRANPIPVPVRKQIQTALNARLDSFEKNSEDISNFLNYVYDAWMKRFDDIELIDSLISKGYNAKQPTLKKEAEFETVLTDTMTGLAGISATKTDVLRDVADDVVYLLEKMNNGVVFDKDTIRSKAVEALEFLINNTYPEQIADGVEDALKRTRLFKIGDSVKRIVLNGFDNADIDSVGMDEQSGRAIAQDMSNQFREMLLHHIAQEFSGKAFSANKLQDIFESLRSVVHIKNDLTNQTDMDYVIQAIEHIKTLSNSTGQKRIEDAQKYVEILTGYRQIEAAMIEDRERSMGNYLRYMNSFASGQIAGIGSQIEDQDWRSQWEGIEQLNLKNRTLGDQRLQEYIQIIYDLEEAERKYLSFRDGVIKRPLMIEDKDWRSIEEELNNMIMPEDVYAQAMKSKIEKLEEDILNFKKAWTGAYTIDPDAFIQAKSVDIITYAQALKESVEHSIDELIDGKLAQKKLDVAVNATTEASIYNHMRKLQSGIDLLEYYNSKAGGAQQTSIYVEQAKLQLQALQSEKGMTIESEKQVLKKQIELGLYKTQSGLMTSLAQDQAEIRHNVFVSEEGIIRLTKEGLTLEQIRNNLMRDNLSLYQEGYNIRARLADNAKTDQVTSPEGIENTTRAIIAQTEAQVNAIESTKGFDLDQKKRSNNWVAETIAMGNNKQTLIELGKIRQQVDLGSKVENANDPDFMRMRIGYMEQELQLSKQLQNTFAGSEFGKGILTDSRKLALEQELSNLHKLQKEYIDLGVAKKQLDAQITKASLSDPKQVAIVLDNTLKNLEIAQQAKTRFAQSPLGESTWLDQEIAKLQTMAKNYQTIHDDLLQQQINREKIAAEERNRRAQDSAAQDLKIQTDYYNKVNKLKEQYGSEKGFGLPQDNVDKMLPGESFEQAFRRLNELETVYKKVAEARQRLNEMGRDDDSFNRANDESSQSWLNRLKAAEKLWSEFERQSAKGHATYEREVNDMDTVTKHGVKHMESIDAIHEAYNRAHPSGKRFWDGMAKAGMVMSGIAASIFVTQQAIMTFGQVMRVYTDIEKQVVSLGESYKWTADQQALLTGAAKRIVKFSAVDSSEFIKSVGEAYKKGMKSVKFSSKKSPLMEVDLGSYIESEYQKALSKTLTIDSAMQRVVNSFKGVLIEAVDGTNDTFIKSLVGFSDYINANSGSIKDFFATLLDSLLKLSSTFALTGQLAGTLVSGLASGAGGMASMFDGIISKLNSVFSLISGFDGIVGGNVAGAGIAYGILGRLFFGSWGPARIIAAAVAGLTLATELQDKAKALNSAGGDVASGLIDIGISGASGYLGMSALQKMIPSITAQMVKLAPTLITGASRLNIWTAAIIAAWEAISLLSNEIKKIPTKQLESVGDDFKTYFYEGPKIEYADDFGQMFDEKKLNEELKETSKNISETIATNVIDGDTLRAALNSSGADKELSEAIRYLFVNTAESVHEDLSRNTGEGLLAKAFMKGLIPDGSKITTEFFEKSDITGGIGKGMNRLVDETGKIVDHHSRRLGMVFVNGTNANLKLIETGLSKYNTDFGISEKYDSVFKQAEANIHPLIIQFHENMNRFMKENELDMTISQKDDPMNFEKLKFATVAFGYELSLLDQKITAFKNNGTIPSVFNIDRLEQEAAAINQLKTSVVLLMNSPELQAMQRQSLYSNYFDETYNKDDYLKKALVQAGHDAGEVDKWLASLRQASTQRWIAEDKKIAEHSKNFTANMIKTQSQLTQSRLGLSQAQVNESERALNNTLKNDNMTSEMRQKALNEYKQDAARELELRKQLTNEKYKIEQDAAEKAYNEEVAAIRSQPNIFGNISEQRKTDAIRIITEQFDVLSEARRVNNQIELQNITTHQANVNDKVTQYNESLTQKQIAAEEKRNAAIQREMEKRLNFYKADANSMLSGITKLQDEITQAEGGANEKKMAQLERNTKEWTRVLDGLAAGVNSGAFKLDMVTALLGGKSVEEVRAEMQSIADGVRPIYEALDELEDLKKTLTNFSLDTSQMEYEQYEDVLRILEQINNLKVEKTLEGNLPGSDVMKALDDAGEKWSEKSKSIYDKVQSEGKTAFNDLYQELQNLGENNLDFQLKVLDVEFMEKANAIANYMWIVEKASVDEIMIVLDQLDRVRKERERELKKTDLEYQGFFGGIEAGIMDLEDLWIDSEHQKGKASRQFIKDTADAYKAFFKDVTKLALQASLSMRNEDGGPMFHDFSGEIEALESELEASSKARETLIFTPQMEEAIARMNQVQVDSSSESYAAQVDQAIEYYAEVERLAQSDQDRLMAAYQKEYYEIEKQRMEDLAGAEGNAAEIAKINADADKAILEAKRTLMDDWYDIQLDAITEMNEKAEESYANLFDAIGDMFQSLMDKILDMFLDMIAELVAQELFKLFLQILGISVNGKAFKFEITGAESLTSVAMGAIGLTEAYGWLTNSAVTVTDALGITSVAIDSAAVAATHAATTTTGAAAAMKSYEIAATSAAIETEVVADGMYAFAAGTEAATVSALSMTGALLPLGIALGGMLGLDDMLFGEGPSTEQVIAEYEAGLRDLTEAQKEYWFSLYLGTNDLFGQISNFDEDYFEQSEAAINAISSHWEGFYDLSLEQMNYLKEQQTALTMGAYNNEINSLTEEQDFTTEAYVSVAVEIAQDSTLTFDEKMYQLGFVATESGWESEATMSMLAEFSDQGIPWETINQALIDYGLTDAEVYKSIYAEYNGVGLFADWAYVESALMLEGLNSEVIKTVSGVYDGTIPFEDLWALLTLQGLSSSQITEIIGYVDPSDEWYDLVIPVDAPSSIPVSGTGDGGGADAFATGGKYDPTRMFWAGEQGMELIDPNTRTVLNHEDSIAYAKTHGIEIPGYAEGTSTYPIEDFLNGDVTIKVMIDQTESSGTTELEMWEDLYKQTAEYLDLLGTLESELTDINEYYEKQIELAQSLNVTEEELNNIYAMQQEVVNQMIEDWADETMSTYAEMMGWSSDLSQALQEVFDQFKDWTKDVEYLIETGVLTDTALQILKIAEAAAILVTIKNYVKEATQSFTDLQLAMIEWAQGLYGSDMVAAYDTLMAWKNMKGYRVSEVTEGDINSYYKNILNTKGMTSKDLIEYSEQLNNFFSSLAQTLEAAYESVMATQENIADSIHELNLDLKTEVEQSAYYAKHVIDAYNNLWNMSAEEQAETIAWMQEEIMEYYNLQKQMLEEVGSVLESTLESVDDAVLTLQMDMRTNAEKSAYYYAEYKRVLDDVYWNPESTNLEQANALEELQDLAMNYYDAEKAAIEDSYNLQIESAEKFYNLAQQWIDLLKQIQDKMFDLKYSDFNRILPRQRSQEAVQDYGTMFSAAQASITNSKNLGEGEEADFTAVQDYMSFIDTYLQAGMDAYKSSQTYLDMYDTVQRDLELLGLSIGDEFKTQTIEELTKEQTDAIKALEDAMEAEIKTLTLGVIDALQDGDDSLKALIKNEIAENQNDQTKLIKDTIASLELLNTQADLIRTDIGNQLLALYNLIEVTKGIIGEQLIKQGLLSVSFDEFVIGLKTYIETYNSEDWKRTYGIVDKLDKFALGVGAYWQAYDSNDWTRTNALISAIEQIKINVTYQNIVQQAISSGGFGGGGNSPIPGGASRPPVNVGGFIDAVRDVFGPIAPGRRALGGPVNAFDPYIIGEVGPELFVPQTSGYIVPNNALNDNSQLNEKTVKILERIAVAVESGSSIYIDGKPVEKIADRVIRKRIDRGMMNDSRSAI